VKKPFSIARDPPDIAVIAGDLSGDNFQPILRAVVGADDLYRSLIVLLQKDTPDRRTALYSAGVDDIAGPTVSPRELASRIKSAERIVRLERRLRERVRELESALSRLEMHAVRRGQAIASMSATTRASEGVPFLLAPSWTAIEKVLGTMCSVPKLEFELIDSTVS
jgi:DNA-binding NarL/FixJ family response regulator